MLTDSYGFPAVQSSTQKTLLACEESFYLLSCDPSLCQATGDPCRCPGLRSHCCIVQHHLDTIRGKQKKVNRAHDGARNSRFAPDRQYTSPRGGLQARGQLFSSLHELCSSVIMSVIASCKYKYNERDGLWLVTKTSLRVMHHLPCLFERILASDTFKMRSVAHL